MRNGCFVGPKKISYGIGALLTVRFEDNLRYAVSYCVFGFPGNEDIENTPCRTSEACGPFQDAIKHENLTSEGLDKYDYCAQWPVTDLEHVENCRICLEVDGNEYLANCKPTLFVQGLRY